MRVAYGMKSIKAFDLMLAGDRVTWLKFIICNLPNIEYRHTVKNGRERCSRNSQRKYHLNLDVNTITGVNHMTTSHKNVVVFPAY